MRQADEVVSTATASRGGTRRRILLRSMAVIAAVAVVGAALWWSGIGRVTRVGPDDAPFGQLDRERTSAWAPVGYPLSFGSVVLHNGTDQPITITAVTVVEREAGITVLGVLLDPSQERLAAAIGSQPLWPAANPGSAYQVAPFVLEPEDRGAPRGVDLVVGVTANRPGRWQARGLQVSYRRGGRDYVTTYDHAFGVCTDAATSCDFNSPDDPWSHPSGPST